MYICNTHVYIFIYIYIIEIVYMYIIYTCKKKSHYQIHNSSMKKRCRHPHHIQTEHVLTYVYIHTYTMRRSMENKFFIHIILSP